MYSKLMSNVFAHMAEMLTLQSIRPFILGMLCSPFVLVHPSKLIVNVDRQSVFDLR